MWASPISFIALVLQPTPSPNPAPKQRTRKPATSHPSPSSRNSHSNHTIDSSSAPPTRSLSLPPSLPRRIAAELAWVAEMQRLMDQITPSDIEVSAEDWEGALGRPRSYSGSNVSEACSDASDVSQATSGGDGGDADDESHVRNDKVREVEVDTGHDLALCFRIPGGWPS